VIAFAAFKLIRDYLKKEEEYKDLDKSRLENELNFLKGQINPHFLFNTLNNLYAFALEKSNKVPDFILKLSEMLRYMLYECNEKYVALEKEVKYLQNYIELQKIRVEERGEIIFNVSGQTGELRIAPSLLINLVENCFKHSVDGSIDDILVKLDLKIEDNVLSFYTENNVAETTVPKDVNEGIGLSNVRKRLEILYPGKYTLELIPNGPTFLTKLELQLQDYDVSVLDR